MSISVLDDCSKELHDAIKNRDKRINRIMKKVKGSENYKAGYKASFSGYDITRGGYHCPDYIKGYCDGKNKEAKNDK